MIYSLQVFFYLRKKSAEVRAEGFNFFKEETVNDRRVKYTG